MSKAGSNNRNAKDLPEFIIDFKVSVIQENGIWQPATVMDKCHAVTLSKCKVIEDYSDATDDI